jgi:uncharacterized protein YkwD
MLFSLRSRIMAAVVAVVGVTVLAVAGLWVMGDDGNTNAGSTASSVVAGGTGGGGDGTGSTGSSAVALASPAGTGTVAGATVSTGPLSTVEAGAGQPASSTSVGPPLASGQVTTGPAATAPPTTPATVPRTPTTVVTAPPTSATAPATTAATQPPAGGLNSVELEVARLTNELRANPAGGLARRKPMPPCINEGFYAITTDGATGHPVPVPALSLNETVSVQMARTWSVEMDRANTMSHRSNTSAVYSQLGISPRASGENVAWFQGYSDAEAARVFFEGWRESDSGHYCALVSGVYANFGVGTYKGASRSWATQNFYSTR